MLRRLFYRSGFKVLIGLTGVSLLFAPLMFLSGHFGLVILGIALWGMGVHESIIPAAVSPMVAQRERGSAFGMFTAMYGVCAFAGNGFNGWIYDQSVIGAGAFCVITQAMAVLVFA